MQDGFPNFPNRLGAWQVVASRGLCPAAHFHLPCLPPCQRAQLRGCVHYTMCATGVGGS